MINSTLNAVLIGNGHYATGITTLEGKINTDKDMGVFFPSLLALRKEKFIDRIFVSGRDGTKLEYLVKKAPLYKMYGWDPTFQSFPSPGIKDSKAYLKALDSAGPRTIALIAVPDTRHKEMMLACIERSIPFLVVKPAVNCLNDLYEVLEKLQKKNIPAFVDYHKIYDPANLLIRHEYLRGDYGRILHVYSQMTQRKDMIDIFESWLGQSPPGAINHYLGSHYIHMTAFISGAKPLNVRATAQYGIVREKFNKPIADIMETQVEWISPNNERFVSYHISGWSDPSETESMTYQELQMLTEKGRIDSDQRFRGFRKVISGAGMSAPNPHFFCPLPGPDGETDLQGQYGYRSVKEFVKTCLSWYTNPHSWGKSLLVNPTLEESEVVTAVLEAADMSLAENSRIVDICIVNDRYRCK